VIGGICISSSLGEVPFSALSTIEPINLVLSAIGALGGVGCGITISKCSGSGDKEMAARVFTRTVIALVAVTAALSVVMFVFADPVLRFLRATPENLAFAREYLVVLCFGSVPIVLMFAGDYLLTDDNDPGIVLIANVVDAVVNIVGNIVGMEVLHFHIGASAFAMVLGNLCGVLVFLRHFKNKDALCRFVRPERREGDPGLFSVLRPGTPMTIMYLMFAVQMIVQNFVLSNESGTSGLGNSAVVDNLVLFLTIFTASASEPVMPLASSYFGEGNHCGVLLVKRSMYRLGLKILVPIVVLLVLFPQLFMALFSVQDPVMLESLPLAIRIVCISSLFTFTNDSMVNFLSATEREHLANISYGIQLVVTVGATLGLSRVIGEDAPWYGTMFANMCSCLFLLVAGRLTRGFVKEYPENALVLTGGHPEAAQVDAWRADTEKVLGQARADTVWEKVIAPFLASDANKPDQLCSYSIIRRDNGDTAAILRYGAHTSLKRLLLGEEGGDEDEDGELEHVYEECVNSEFNTLQRKMINFKGE
jgi:Na+-driven multidrug efflux pump